MRGAAHRVIAAAVGVSVPTLRKAFAVELKARAGVDLFEATGTEAAKARQAARRGAGRPALAVTSFKREEVEGYVAVGMAPIDIARALGVSEPTLRKHFAEELAVGAARTEARLVKALMGAGLRGNVGALRDLLDRVAATRLEALQGRVAEARDGLTEAPGKKAQAELAAVAEQAEGAWSDLMQPRPH